MNTQELIETFALMGDWEERYQLLIDLGKELEAMPEALKNEHTLVKGCTSRVWIIPKIENGKFDFIGDSDAHIVRGLVSILHIIYAGVDEDKIKDIDVAAIFSKLGLEEHLTPNRRNGFYSMVERIKSFSANP